MIPLCSMQYGPLEIFKFFWNFGNSDRPCCWNPTLYTKNINIRVCNGTNCILKLSTYTMSKFLLNTFPVLFLIVTIQCFASSSHSNRWTEYPKLVFEYKLYFADTSCKYAEISPSVAYCALQSIFYKHSF